MTADVTEEGLQKVRDENAALRDKIEAKKAEKADREATVTRTIEATQLLTENERLKAELARWTDEAKVGAVKAGAEGVLSSVEEQLAVVQAQGDQPIGVPVDTTEGKPPKPEDQMGFVAPDEDPKDKDKNGGNS